MSTSIAAQRNNSHSLGTNQFLKQKEPEQKPVEGGDNPSADKLPNVDEKSAGSSIRKKRQIHVINVNREYGRIPIERPQQHVIPAHTWSPPPMPVPPPRLEPPRHVNPSRASNPPPPERKNNEQAAKELTRKLDAFKAHAAAEKWGWEPIEANIDNIKEDHEWEHYVKYQNVPRAPRLHALLEPRIKRFKERAVAENRMPWEIEYGIEEIKDSHQWWHFARHEPRAPRLQRLAELKRRLEREYNEQKGKELTQKIEAFKTQATPDKWAPWAIEHGVESIKENHEWEHYTKYQNIPREPRLQKLLDRMIRLIREAGAAEKWSRDVLEYNVEAAKENHDWHYHARHQNIPRAPRLQKLLDTRIRLIREAGAAEKWSRDVLEYNVEAAKENHDWHYHARHQNIPRAPRLQKLLDTRIRLIREAAATEKWSRDVLEYNVEAAKENHDWHYHARHQNIPREPRLQKLLDTRIRLIREAGATEKWSRDVLEYNVEAAKENHDWHYHARHQNISRAPRLQRLAELKTRLEREHNQRLQAGKGQVVTDGKLATGTEDTAAEKSWFEKIVTVTGGVGEMYVGGALLAANDPTLMTKIAGLVLAKHGVDRVSPELIGKHNYQFLMDWHAGTLPERIVYAPNSIQIKDMAASPKVQQEIAEFYAKGAPAEHNFKCGTYEALWKTIVNPLTANLKSTAMQVGGYIGATIKNNGDGTMTIRIENTAGMNSFFYHLVSDRREKTGPMHNVKQIFEWTQPIDPNRLPKN